MRWPKLKTPRSGEIYVMNHARTRSAGYDFLSQAQPCSGRRSTRHRRQRNRTAASAAGRPWKPPASKPESPVSARTWMRRTWPRKFWTRGRSVTPKAVTSARKSSPASAPMARWPSPCAACACPTICPRCQSRATNYFMGEKKSAASPAPQPPRVLKTNIALAYVRREANQIGTELLLQMPSENVPAQIVELPFVP